MIFEKYTGRRLTVKLGSMLFVGFGLTIAAMRLWL